MSYILDALRKADAQRERDPARGIHAQPGAGPQPVPQSAGRQPAWVWVALAAAFLSLLAAAWQLTRPAVPAAPAVAAAPAPTPPAPAPMPATAVLPEAPPPAVPPPPPPPPVAAAPAAQAPRATASAASAGTPAVAVAQARPASAPAASDRVLALADLPPDVARELPKLAISGGVYSSNPAQRMLIVNGQVFNEGAELAPGLVLEQIRDKTAVLRTRGYRYALPY